MKILIITGGISPERAISLKSSRNVARTLKKNGHKVEICDLKDGHGGILNRARHHDILFPVLHGEEGEAGKLHKFLDKIDKPIVGTRNHTGLKKSWYKIPFKKFAAKKEIPTSEWKIIRNKKDIVDFGLPCVLKASNGGSSKEVFVLNSKEDLKNNHVKQILNTNQAFIENYLSGIEITVGILNKKALPVIEITPKNNSWFSYKAKYDGTTDEIPFAPSVKPRIQKKAQEIALLIHEHFDLGTYSRTDFIVSNGLPYALEINTIPGLTSESLLPKAAKASGINFSEFLNILISNAR